MVQITYEQFKAAVTPTHLRLLIAIAHKQDIRIIDTDTTQIAALKATMSDLLVHRLVTTAREIWEWQGESLYHGFDAVLDPTTVAYLIQLTQDGLDAIRAP